jgi:hypothetical protein
MKRILVVTNPEDLHAFLVSEALSQKGAETVLWQSTDFPCSATETVIFEGETQRFQLAALGVQGPEAELDAVWVRRPGVMWGPSKLHEADREFADLQCRISREGLLSVLAPDAFWVNPPGSSARLRSKLFQHEQAVRVGMHLPDTAYTNDPEVIRGFIRKYGGVVYKAYHPMIWQEAEASWGTFTIAPSEEDLVADHVLQAVPGIYQAMLPKAFELRVTIMGRHVFAAKILSQETQAGRIDWRLAWSEIKMERVSLDSEVTRKCLALMERLGIVFGCLDFIVTPEGEHVFLEVNQMGQFAFVENYCGMPLIDAMSELLLQGRVDFDWEEKAARVHLSEIQERALARMEEYESRHLRRPSPSSSDAPVRRRRSSRG